MSTRFQEIDPANEAAQKNLRSALKNLRLLDGLHGDVIHPDSVAQPISNSDSWDKPAVEPSGTAITGDGPFRGLVVASLTTIPPRIDDSCRRAIDSLLPQVSDPDPRVSYPARSFEAPNCGQHGSRLPFCAVHLA